MGVASCKWVRPLLTTVVIFLFQAAEGLGQFVHGREEVILDAQHRGDVHGRGEGIVGGLGHVDVVVGVEQLFAGDLIAAGWR